MVRPADAILDPMAKRRGVAVQVYMPEALKARLEAERDLRISETPRDQLPKYFGTSDVIRELLERGIDQLEQERQNAKAGETTKPKGKSKS